MLVWEQGRHFNFFLGGQKIFSFFNATGLLKNWKKQHFICSNLTFPSFFLFFPFFSFFFFLNLFFFSFSLGAAAPSPLKWRPCLGVVIWLAVINVYVLRPYNDYNRPCYNEAAVYYFCHECSELLRNSLDLVPDLWSTYHSVELTVSKVFKYLEGVKAPLVPQLMFLTPALLPEIDFIFMKFSFEFLIRSLINCHNWNSCYS